MVEGVRPHPSALETGCDGAIGALAVDDLGARAHHEPFHRVGALTWWCGFFALLDRPPADRRLGDSRSVPTGADQLGLLGLRAVTAPAVIYYIW